MEKRKLIIGIDYTDTYCQTSYYSRRHERPESIAYGGEAVRYLIPTTLCFNHETKDWMIGQPAVDYTDRTGERLYRDFLENIMLEEAVFVNGQEYSYTQLLAVFIGKIIELTQVATSVMGVESITVNMRRVTMELKKTMQDVFSLLKLPEEKVKLQTCAESFAYYILNEEPGIRKKGAILFDFSADGFFEKVLTVTRGSSQPLIYISERTHNADFSMDDMGNAVLMDQMDERLKQLYEEITAESQISSVFFTGEGFHYQWFAKTLKAVSESNRAFKGNNLYAKGACLAGLFRSEEGEVDHSIICAGRTRSTILVEAKEKEEAKLIELSRAPQDWFDAAVTMDFIVDEPEVLRFVALPLIGSKKTSFTVDISKMPRRIKKATRVELSLRFLDESSLEVTVKDKGFGELFPPSGFSVTQKVDLTDEF